ncbi:MAG: DnaJ domain-containing protein [Nitrospirae bacterium]|nr:DnaJ domain-containing protein [Nitrospirota bacterium]
MAAEKRAWRVPDLREKLLILATDLKIKLDDRLGLAIDRSLESQWDLDPKLEEQLAHVSYLTEQILLGIRDSSLLHDLRTFENRLNFLEDRFDELDSRLRNRPRRRRNKIHMADFFTASQEGFKANPTPDDVRSANEAYEILGLSQGSPLKEIIRAFRRKVKELHPDSRNGDRSQEAELRKLLAAYEFLKSYGG